MYLLDLKYMVGIYTNLQNRFAYIKIQNACMNPMNNVYKCSHLHAHHNTPYIHNVKPAWLPTYGIKKIRISDKKNLS